MLLLWDKRYQHKLNKEMTGQPAGGKVALEEQYINNNNNSK